MNDLKDNKNIELSTEELNIANKIQELIDKTNSTQLICNYEIGKLIDEAYGDQKKYGTSQIERIAEQVGKAPSTLYGYLGLAQDYTEADIQSLAYGKFSTPYKLLRDYKKLGRDEVMRIYAEVDSLNELKIRLKEHWLELKTQKDNENQKPTIDPHDGEGDPKKDLDVTPAPDNENSPRGENSPPSEDDPSSPSTTNSDDKSPQDQNEDDTPNSEDDDSSTEMPPAPNSDTKSEPDKVDPQENGSPKTSMHDQIKQSAGSTTNFDPPVDDDSKTAEDMLKENNSTTQTEPDDEMVPIAKSRLAKLEELEKENKNLKAQVSSLQEAKESLEQENNELVEEVEELKDQLSEARIYENEPALVD